MSAKIKIDVEKLNMLFDLVVQSMDFGSGFLDHEDVTLLREIAGIIGVDPMEATPSEFRKRIVHTYREAKGNPWVSATTGEPAKRPCYWCGKLRDAEIHTAEVPPGLSRETDPGSSERLTDG